MRLGRSLRDAVDGHRFELRFQPIAELVSGDVHEYEASLHWPERPGLSAATIVRSAERHGVIGPLGRWLLGESCHQLAEWRARVPGFDLTSVALLVSSLQFDEVAPSLVETFAAGLTYFDLPGWALWLEVDWRDALERADAGLAVEQLLDMGVRTALVDVDHRSDLDRIARLGVARVRLSPSLVRLVLVERSAGRAIASIARRCRALGLGMVADGVDSRAQMLALVDLDCRVGQGHHLGGPTAPEEIVRRLRRQWSNGTTSAS